MRVKKVFLCRSCGTSFARWMGKCPDCGAWDSLEEQSVDPSATSDPQRGLIESWRAGGGGDAADGAGVGVGAGEGGGGGGGGGGDSGALPIATVDRSSDALAERIASGIAEFDRVLGGGLVAGSAVLVGGDPGIGKSTLLLQVAGAIGGAGKKVLYVSSEESARQIGLRADRLCVGDPAGLFVLADTNLARIIEQARRVLPDVMVIDSVQMIYKGDLDASPGSVTQLRRCCAELVYLAKLSGIAVVLVGHVTKEGQLAGPRLLEHLVDAVLYFEGDRYHAHRVVRTVKNRFGTTMEIGLFDMTGVGLREVEGGVSAAAAEGLAQSRPGSVTCAVMTGSRCALVEVQALTATGFLGAAKRKSSGIDPNRLAMLIAVLEQHAELRLADRDVFASSVGGVRVVEPAGDLALLLAIGGAHFRRGLEARTAVVGEVGLGGEVRAVSQLDHRVHEAGRLGVQTLIVPASQVKQASVGTAGKKGGLRVIGVGTVNEAMGLLG